MKIVITHIYGLTKVHIFKEEKKAEEFASQFNGDNGFGELLTPEEAIEKYKEEFFEHKTVKNYKETKNCIIEEEHIEYGKPYPIYESLIKKIKNKKPQQ